MGEAQWVWGHLFGPLKCASTIPDQTAATLGASGQGEGSQGGSFHADVKNLFVNPSQTKFSRAWPSFRDSPPLLSAFRFSLQEMVLGEGGVSLLPFLELGGRVDVKEDVGAKLEGFSGAAGGG